MEYSGKVPEGNVNVSKRSPLQEMALLLGGLTGLCFLLYLVLGWTVDYAVQYITPEQEQVLYDHIKFSEGFKVEDDSGRTQAVQTLLGNLKDCAPLPYPVTVQVVDDNQVNAAAFPGGHVLVFSGLLDQIESENELAFVLGHELGHFKHRDHLRGMGRGIVLFALALFLMGPDTDVGGIIFNTFGVAQQAYSRQQESAADRYALDVVHCHYGHVGGSAQFFEMMKEKSKTPAFLKYYSSHPTDQKRIDDLKALAEKKQYKVAEVVPWQEPVPQKKSGHPAG